MKRSGPIPFLPDFPRLGHPMKRPWILRLALCALLPLLLVAPGLLPGRSFLPQLPTTSEPLASEYPELLAASQTENQLTSDRLFPILTDEILIREQLSAGVLPTWEPRLGLGAPLAAGSMAGPWYPPRFLLIFLSPELAGGVHALLALWLAGLGLWFFLERRGLSTAACAMGAIALQAGGFGIANLHYVMKVDAVLWLPWCLWAIEGMKSAPRRAGLVLFAATGHCSDNTLQF